MERLPSVVVATVGELEPGRSRKFFLSHGAIELECFVVNFEGELFAYVNRCCHVPMTMDWVENRFFTEDGQYILCATHGAMYCPRSGECVAGPAYGKMLQSVPLTIEGNEIVATFPIAEMQGTR